jgi:hypothetical protein
MYSTDTRNPAIDSYVYTTGRWLKYDKLQRDARYVKFDFEALCTRAVNVCKGATRVVRYEKKKVASTESSSCL